jgi:hypothetical protein
MLIANANYIGQSVLSDLFANEYSMNFDGIDEAITFSRDATYDSVLKHSISVWFKCTSLGSGTRYMFDTGRHRVGFIGSTSQLRYQIIDSPTTDDIRISGLTITDGNWHHILATFDGSTQIAKVYYDGVLVNTKNPTNNSSTDPQLNYGIGASYLGTGNFFIGNVDEVAFWHDTDQSANITDIYNGGIPTDLNSLPTGPTNWVRMGDGATWDGATWNLPDLGVMNGNPRSINMEEADRQTDVP